MTRPAGWYHCRVSGGLSLRRSAALVDRYADVGIAIAALLLFVPGLGAVHLFDRDEINFAEIAREMLVTGQWSQPSVGFRPFYEKPPLFMWLQAASMSIFGSIASAIFGKGKTSGASAVAPGAPAAPAPPPSSSRRCVW